MQRFILLAGTCFVLSLGVLTTVPASAITAREKMVTCKFGADDQKLVGKARARFLKRCMSNRNDPRGPAVGSPVAAPAPKG